MNTMGTECRQVKKLTWSRSHLRNEFPFLGVKNCDVLNVLSALELLKLTELSIWERMNSDPGKIITYKNKNREEILNSCRVQKIGSKTDGEILL